MPVIDKSSYRPPLLFSSPDVQTVFPSVFRKVPGVSYRRERVPTPDGDFLDLDSSCVNAERLAIVLHGLEGNSERAYARGMVRALNRRGWDAMAVNFRGCGGQANARLRFYHSGDTDDLRAVIGHATGQRSYAGLALIGFSLGGNVVLKYLGETGASVHPLVRAAVTISAPCDLGPAAEAIGRPRNRLYMKRFLRMLHEKIRMKMEIFPGKIDDRDFHQIKDFRDFDERYTAPLHGFTGANDYWTKASSKPFLPNIAVPTLMISAADDPFLSPSCFPRKQAGGNSRLFLEIPQHGGHVGFVAFNPEGEYWSESRATAFLEWAWRETGTPAD